MEEFTARFTDCSRVERAWLQDLYTAVRDRLHPAAGASLRVPVEQLAEAVLQSVRRTVGSHSLPVSYTCVSVSELLSRQRTSCCSSLTWSTGQYRERAKEAEQALPSHKALPRANLLLIGLLCDGRASGQCDGFWRVRDVTGSVHCEVLKSSPLWLGKLMLFPSWNYISQDAPGLESGYLELIESPICVTPEPTAPDPAEPLSEVVGVRKAARLLRQKVNGGVRVCVSGEVVWCVSGGVYFSDGEIPEDGFSLLETPGPTQIHLTQTLQGLYPGGVWKTCTSSAPQPPMSTILTERRKQGGRTAGVKEGHQRDGKSEEERVKEGIQMDECSGQSAQTGRMKRKRDGEERRERDAPRSPEITVTVVTSQARWSRRPRPRTPACRCCFAVDSKQGIAFRNLQTSSETRGPQVELRRHGDMPGRCAEVGQRPQKWTGGGERASRRREEDGAPVCGFLSPGCGLCCAGSSVPVRGGVTLLSSPTLIVHPQWRIHTLTQSLLCAQILTLMTRITLQEERGQTSAVQSLINAKDGVVERDLHVRLTLQDSEAPERSLQVYLDLSHIPYIPGLIAGGNSTAARFSAQSVCCAERVLLLAAHELCDGHWFEVT
ncbi:hypothetical protein AOLI_G00153070 [Acnodon oligacanthus]